MRGLQTKPTKLYADDKYKYTKTNTVFIYKQNERVNFLTHK